MYIDRRAMSSVNNPNVSKTFPVSGPVSYQFNAVRNINFGKVLDRRTDFEWQQGEARPEGILTPAANQRAKKLYGDIQGAIKRYGMKYTKASVNLLICLREVHEKPKRRARRDNTSAYVHEFAQILYAVWMFENRGRIDTWLSKRLNANDLHPNLQSDQGHKDIRLKRRLLQTRGQLDVVAAASGNHDSMEDLGLKGDGISFALRNVPLSEKKNVNTIARIIRNLTKQPGDIGDVWMNRASRNELSLLCKMMDRTHNVATMLGSDRSEAKILRYLEETEVFLDRASPMIRNNGTLTYMAQYLYDQAALIHMYYDVKHQKLPFVILEENANTLCNRYLTTTIDRSIHPMLCILERIMQDEAILDNLRGPDKGLAAAPSALPAPAVQTPKPALRT